jgi:hypothetical protein
LQGKGLIVYLTPPGRGSVVTHALYLDRELEKVRREAGAAQSVAVTSSAPSRVPHADAPESADLSGQLDSLQQELADVRQELDAARSEFAAVTDELRRGLAQLNQQLGN